MVIISLPPALYIPPPPFRLRNSIWGPSARGPSTPRSSPSAAQSPPATPFQNAHMSRPAATSGHICLTKFAAGMLGRAPRHR